MYLTLKYLCLFCILWNSSHTMLKVNWPGWFWQWGTIQDSHTDQAYLGMYCTLFWHLSPSLALLDIMPEISGRYGNIAYVLMPEFSGSRGSERVKFQSCWFQYWKTVSSWVRWSSTILLKMIISSIKTRHISHWSPASTLSISLWNMAGVLVNPKGMTLNW